MQPTELSGSLTRYLHNSRFKLKRTLIFKLGTTDMIEQSKTHPFNISKGVKTFLPCIMKKENKAVNFYFVFESFLSNFIESK